MDGGKIVADGAHDDIYESSSIYRKLYDQQLAS
jgi:ABC-type multidrug transport system fused ATPase/permease subunit